MLFRSLRATRETELMAKFPLKDVTRWIGNSERIALAHYAMTSDEAFQNATTSRSVVASVVASQGNQEPRSNPQEKTEIAKTQQKTARDGAVGFPDVAIKGDEWALRDSNPRPSRCKRDALTN